MDSKHTPGPWYLASTDNGAQAHLQTSARETDTYIALIDTMDTEQDANARLIAAAPALLEAAKALIDELDGHIGAGVEPYTALRAAVESAS
tara:strand:- start:1311 stop:1583 length:273 start_codon:yes stop_codon:yes gene_type:complete